MNLIFTEQEVIRLKELCRHNEQALLFIYEKENNRLKNATKKSKQKQEKLNILRENLRKKANEFREQLIKNQTDSEKRFKIYLQQLGIKYDFQKIIFYQKSFYIVDFYIPSKKVVFEIDGGYHNTKDQREKDYKRTEILRNFGIKEVYRFTNEETNNFNSCTERIKNIIK